MRPTNALLLSLLICLALTVACETPKADRETPDGEQSAPAASEEDADSECVEQCIDDQQMRSVSMEVIRADCEEECAGE
jgi:hypothetical protein